RQAAKLARQRGQAGFGTKVVDTRDLNAVKQRLSVPDNRLPHGAALVHTRERNVRVHIATAQEYRSVLQRSRIGPRCPIRAYQPRTQSNHGAIASGLLAARRWGVLDTSGHVGRGGKTTG